MELLNVIQTMSNYDGSGYGSDYLRKDKNGRSISIASMMSDVDTPNFHSSNNNSSNSSNIYAEYGRTHSTSGRRHSHSSMNSEGGGRLSCGENNSQGEDDIADREELSRGDDLCLNDRHYGPLILPGPVLRSGNDEGLLLQL